MSNDNSLRQMLQPVQNFKVSLSDFKKEHSIGQGAYAEVFLAIHIPTQMKTALKVLSAKKLEGPSATYFVREVMILASCQNPFLVQFLGYTDSYPYCIVTQYIEHGTLYDALKHKEGSPNIDNTDKTNIAMCIAYGMISLHKNKIIHRDLKSLNILLDSNCLPKIIDFGISRFHGEENELVTSTIGTPHWMAPEMFNSTHYDNKVDVYAYGILLWEMLTEGTPFEGMNAFQIMSAVCQNNLRPELPENTPTGLANLINACWAPDPADRPDFVQIYNYFASLNAYFGEDVDLSIVQDLADYISQIDNSSEQCLIEEQPPHPKEPKKKIKNSLSSTKVSFDDQDSSSGKQAIHKKIHQHSSATQIPIPPVIDLDPNEMKQNSTIEIHKRSHRNSSSHRSKHTQIPKIPDVGINSYDSEHEYSIESAFTNRKSKQRQSFSQKKQNSDSIPHLDDKSQMHRASRSKTIQTPGKESLIVPNDILFEKLENPNAHGYKNNLDVAIKAVTKDNALSFFRHLTDNLLYNEIYEKRKILIIHKLVKLITKRTELVEELANSNIINVFPYDIPNVVSDILEIYCCIAKFKPSLILYENLQKLFVHLPNNEKKFLVVLSLIKDKTDLNPSFPILVQLYTKNSGYFLESDQAENFIKIIFEIYVNNPGFINVVQQAFTLALSSSNSKIVKLGYTSLCNIQTNFKALPLELIVTHFEKYPIEATSLIARLPQIPNSNRLVNGLLKAVNHTPLAVYLICKICDSPKGANLLFNNDDWLTPNKFNISYQLMIFLSIFVYQELRIPLIQKPNVIVLFKSVIECCSYDSIQAIVTVIRRVTSLQRNYVAYLSETGFLKEFFKVSFAQYNSEMVRVGFLLLDNISRVGFVNDYLDIIPYFPTILQDPANQTSALSIMIVLSHYPQTKELFILYKLPELISKINFPVEYESYKNGFISFFNQ